MVKVRHDLLQSTEDESCPITKFSQTMHYSVTLATMSMSINNSGWLDRDGVTKEG